MRSLALRNSRLLAAIALSAPYACGESNRPGENAPVPLASITLPSLDSLPPCLPSRESQVYFVTSEQLLYACAESAWTPMPAGPTSPMGVDTLLVTTALPAGTSDCEAGGVRVESGADANADGVLAATEVEHTALVCNDAAGSDAAIPGDAGTREVDGAAVNAGPIGNGEFPIDAGAMVEVGPQGAHGPQVSPGNALGGLRAISAGEAHTCAVLGDQTARCWGGNAHGQLGDGSTTSQPRPGVVKGLDGAVDISAGDGHSCALLASGKVRCWGDNTQGQLGDGTTTSRPAPVDVAELANVRRIVAGRAYTCALLSTGQVKCWGDNAYGQLGDGTSVGRVVPTAVPGLSAATDLSADSMHTCARTQDGGLYCWGANGDGQLGDGSRAPSLLPKQVLSPGDSFVQVTAGSSFTCATLRDATVKCWGYNSYGQLGDGSMNAQPNAAPVRNLSGALLVAAGVYHTCALTSTGGVSCWGYNGRGQLGDGTRTARSTQAPVTHVTGANRLSVGAHHSCVMWALGTAQCWGANDHGQLGDGTLEVATTPVTVGF
jgi:alpha-tubulin suppressor-like RCC1 family protein